MRIKRRAATGIMVAAIAVGALGAVAGCRNWGAPAQIETLPDVVWFPVREQYHVAEGPILALDERRGHFAPHSSFWVSVPTTASGVGRHLVVPHPVMSPPLWDRARLYIATETIVNAGGVDHVMFRQAATPTDAEALAAKWARQGLPDWTPPK